MAAPMEEPTVVIGGRARAVKRQARSSARRARVWLEGGFPEDPCQRRSGATMRQFWERSTGMTGSQYRREPDQPWRRRMEMDEIGEGVVAVVVVVVGSCCCGSHVA
jgi:hypothetical protein